MTKKKKTTEGLTVSKEKFSEWYSEVIEKAEIADIRHGMKGFFVIRPWGAVIMENMFNAFEKTLQKKGHKPTFFPSIVSEKNLTKESEHVAGFTPEVFWLEKRKDEERFALRPTSETLFTPMFALWIRSHRDMPMKLYQRGSVFRYDTKSTRVLIRTREIIWIEAHDAFSTKKEAEAQIQEDIKTTEEVMHQIFGIPFLPMKRPEWDKFAGAEYTIGSDVLMPDGKLIQQPSTHLLGQKFSKAFDAKFENEKGKEDYIWTTAYGPAMSRIIASVISTHGDDKGLIIPYTLVPTQIIIVPIFNKKNKTKVLKECKKINDTLLKLNVRSELDNRDYSVGWKYNEWELKGVPFRLEIGGNELKKKQLTLYIRDQDKKVDIKVKDLSKIPNLGKKFDERIKTKADDFMKGKLISCKTKEEVKKVINNGKIARINFCSTEKSGISCADKIEKYSNSEIRGTLANKKEKANGKCIICNKTAKEIVYIGKSY